MKAKKEKPPKWSTCEYCEDSCAVKSLCTCAECEMNCCPNCPPSVTKTDATQIPEFPELMNK